MANPTKFITFTPYKHPMLQEPFQIAVPFDINPTVNGLNGSHPSPLHVSLCCDLVNFSNLSNPNFMHIPFTDLFPQLTNNQVQKSISRWNTNPLLPQHEVISNTYPIIPMEQSVQSNSSKVNNDSNPERYTANQSNPSLQLCHKQIVSEFFRNQVAESNPLHLPNGATDEKSQCHYCGKSFSRKGNLKQHIKIHTNERNFKCRHCSKSFHQRHTLIDHERCHTGEKPFVCDLCGKRFRVKNNMRVHRRIHTGEKPYVCSICSKAHSSKSGYNSHMKHKHRKNRKHKQKK